MKTPDLQILLAGILFLLSVVTGIWLSRNGRPLNKIIFSFHKIIAIVAIVLSLFLAYRLHKNIILGNIGSIVLVFAVLLILVVLVTGAFLSFEKFAKAYISIIHKIVALLLLMDAVAALIIK